MGDGIGGNTGGNVIGMSGDLDLQDARIKRIGMIMSLFMVIRLLDKKR